MPNSVESSTPEPTIEEATSLDDHEQQFPVDGATPRAPARDAENDDDEPPAAAAPESRNEKGQFSERHRAKSQRATPEDVEEIALHTKRLREAEDAIGIKQKPGESDRVFGLRRRAEIAALAKANGQRAAAPEPPKREPATPPAQAETFTDPEPQQDQFLDQPDPYGSYLRALGAYDRKKEAFEQRQASQKTLSETEQKERSAQFQQFVEQTEKTHADRMTAYVTANPDAKAALDKVGDMPITPVIYAAIQLHEQGPQLMRMLAESPETLEDLYLLTYGKSVGYPPSENPLVATVQRRLVARMQAVNTGSAAPPRLPNRAPRPPNPVRTAPQTPSSETPPAEASSLAEHERYWGPNKRR